MANKFGAGRTLRMNLFGIYDTHVFNIKQNNKRNQKNITLDSPCKDSIQKINIFICNEEK